MFACKIWQGVGAWLPHCKCKSSRHECFEKNQVLELGTYCGYSAMVWLGTTIFSAVAAGKILTPFSGPIATLGYVQWPEESIQGSVGCLKLSQTAWTCSLVKITVVLPWPSHSCGESCIVQYTSSLDEKTMRTVRHYLQQKWHRQNKHGSKLICPGFARLVQGVWSSCRRQCCEAQYHRSLKGPYGFL